MALSQKINRDWHDIEIAKIKQFEEKYNLDIKSQIINEQQKHDNFTKTNDITLMPTILINGYLLPIEYTIEDVMTYIE
ncbi:MAG: hypothetical protein QM751_03945 [Paludibacteraceae bacterium]